MPSEYLMWSFQKFDLSLIDGGHYKKMLYLGGPKLKINKKDLHRTSHEYQAVAPPE